MSKSTIWIAFNNGGIIPAGIIGEGSDKAVSAHEPVKVPQEYGKHLIDDRFAYEAKAPASKSEKELSGRGPSKASRIAALGSDVAAMRKSMEAEVDPDARTRLAAELAKAEDDLKALEAG